MGHPTMNLHNLTNDYQQLLEHHRRDPDDEDYYHKMRETYVALERAWLEKALNLPDAGA